MDVKTSCPNCGQHILVDSTAIGQQVACPTCSKPFTISPTPLPVSPSQPPPPTIQTPPTRKSGMAIQMSEPQSIQSMRNSVAVPLPEWVTVIPLSHPFRVQKDFADIPKCNRSQAEELLSQQNLPIAIDHLLLCESFYKPSRSRKSLGCLAALAAWAAVAVVFNVIFSIVGFSIPIIGFIFCGGAAFGAYTAIARPSRTKSKTTELPALGKYSFVVAQSETIYVFPLVLAAADFACDRALKISISNTDVQVLNKGQRIQIVIVPGVAPLVLAIHLHEISKASLANRDSLKETLRYFERYSPHQATHESK